jgi:hypothetical protein
MPSFMEEEKVAGRNHFIDLFTGFTWDEFKKAGGNISGFRESRWKSVQRIKKGDYLLCYLTGVSRFIGILEVVKEAFKDEKVIWSDENFPCRLGVKIVFELSPETAVPVHEMRDKLSFFKDSPSPVAWTGHFRGSPALWKQEDGVAVVSAIQEASKNPVSRPVDPKKLARRPRAIQAKIGSVFIPDEADEPPEDAPTAKSQDKSFREHTEIQHILLRLGNDMGFDVWVARNDKNKGFNGENFSDIPRIKNTLPLQFDDATNRTIELIDVLWLKGNAIVAAFEIESTTSIYSGLLRMSDLITMQPNLNIPLYLVAPDEKRNKVISEINRPTFSKLVPPLYEICRFISFSTLHEELPRIKTIIRYLKPEYLEEISESCEIEEA